LSKKFADFSIRLGWNSYIGICVISASKMRTPSMIPVWLGLSVISVFSPGCNPAHAGRAFPEVQSDAPAAAPGAPSELADVIEKVLPSIVSVQSTRTAKNESPMGFFFGAPPAERKQQGLGSGVILSSDGLIATNNHVIEGADELVVKTNDDREFVAKVLGADAKSDLALLKIQPEGPALVPARLGDSSKLRLGETVLAVGNPFGVGQTVTMGIVSAKGRADMGIVDYEDFIQTDAAINPGNSGGALVNTRGELIGINTAILSRTGGYMGIGFAIPSNMATPILDSLKASGHVTRGFLGVTLQEMTRDLREALGVEEGGGVLVADVAQGSPGALAGLQSGDVVTQINGKPVESVGRLRNAVASAGAGKGVELTVLRDKKRIRLNAVLGTLPSEEGANEASPTPSPAAPDVGGLVLGALTPEVREQLGLGKEVSGVVVMRVAPGSKVANAQIRRGDVILEMNRKPVRTPEEAKNAWGLAGTRLFVILRGGQRRYVVVK
jgi:serine protease Do